MSLHHLRQLPSGMLLIDNQRQGRDAQPGSPRPMQPREVVNLLGSASSKYNRSPAEAFRIAAMADETIQGRETVAERMIHSSDGIARQHEIEQDKAAKIQGLCTETVYVSPVSNDNSLILNDSALDIGSNELRNSVKNQEIAGRISGACDLPDTKLQSQASNINANANPTGTPKSETTPPYGDRSTSDYNTPPHRENLVPESVCEEILKRASSDFYSGYCKSKESGEVFEAIQWTGENLVEISELLRGLAAVGVDSDNFLTVIDYERQFGFTVGHYLTKDSEDEIEYYTAEEFNRKFVRL